MTSQSCPKLGAVWCRPRCLLVPLPAASCPALPQLSDVGSATIGACFDFGTTLLEKATSPLRLALAIHLLEHAHALNPDSLEIAYNLALAFACDARWERALELFERLERCGHPYVRQAYDRVRETSRRNGRLELEGLPFFSLDRASAELFQGEAECKRLHSFTPEAG